MRIGNSIDVHQFDESRTLVLGGVEIDHIGLKGHSDADVLLHVVAESILGALCLGDLGKYFPETEEFKDIKSSVIVKRVVEIMEEKKYYVNNIDCMVLAEKPKMTEHIIPIRHNIAKLLHVDVDCVSVKATTTEHLGFVGRGEGVVSMATVLLMKIDEK